MRGTITHQIERTADLLRCALANGGEYSERWLEARVEDVLEEARRLRLDDRRVALLEQLLGSQHRRKKAGADHPS